AVPDYVMIAAGAFRAAKDLQQSAAVLEQFLTTTPVAGMDHDVEMAVEARCLYGDVLCELDLPQAQVRFDALPEAGTPAVARATAIFARALREAGASVAANRYLESVRVHLGTSPEARDRLLLADSLAEFGDCEAAVALYGQDVSTGCDTPSLR